jgi:hypothetical protein
VNRETIANVGCSNAGGPELTFTTQLILTDTVTNRVAVAQSTIPCRR